VPLLFPILPVKRSPIQQLSPVVPETLPTATSTMELVIEAQIHIVSLENPSILMDNYFTFCCTPINNQQTVITEAGRVFLISPSG
jgi:hypothetical protein